MVKLYTVILFMLTKEYNISELVLKIKELIESNFYYVKVIGEVSDLKISSNGHQYFNLKDNSNLINAVLFKYTKNKYNLENGMLIKAFARLTTYKERSNYQLIIEAFEPNGEGELLKLFEEKKKKLESLGLFSIEHKKPIPKIIKNVGIISSPTGAAIKDIEVRLRERKPINTILFPAIVQGVDAENSIIKGIEYFNKTQNKPDVIIITRGGGSLEDLMCFNGEKLAYAIYNSDLPIITAIGHEIDYTIADFVGDFRLPTPTAVAEFITESKISLLEKLNSIFNRIKCVIFDKINKKIRKFNYVLNKSIYILKDKKLKIIEYKCIKLNDIFNKIIIKIINNFKNKLKLYNKVYQRIKYKKNTIIIKKDGKIINKNTILLKDDILSINLFGKKVLVKIVEI